MSKNKDKKEKSKLAFNTYCVFSEESQDIRETIGLVFKDYLQNSKIEKE